MNTKRWFTVNTFGNNTDMNTVWHSYYASGITAFEVLAESKRDAANLIRKMGLRVLFVFE